MAEKALILELRPKARELRSARKYTEEQVKRILYAFARDLGCKWRADKLRKFVDTVFEE